MKKNILLVANWDSNVGYAWWLMENFWSIIAHKFSSQGIKSILIYPSISVIPDIIKNSPIEIIKHDYDDSSHANVKRLESIINEHNIGHIYLSDKPETCFRYLRLKLWNINTIIVHDHTPGDRPKLTGLKLLVKKLIKRLPLINADCFIAVTPFVKERMIFSSGIPENKCFIAKNGINHIGRDTKNRYYCHDAFNIPHNSTLIISTGRANYYKRIDFLIDCFAMLLQKNNINNLYFVFCGEGPHLQDFKESAINHGITDKFIFAGKRNDVNLLLQSCDIGIQASKGEVGYSLSILEYMSAGLATLVADKPSVCQSIIDGVDGLHYEHNNISSACEKLSSVINNQELREKLGANAIESVKVNYTFKQTNKQLLDILDKFI